MEAKIDSPHIVTIPVMPCTHSRPTISESAVQLALEDLVLTHDTVEGKVLAVLLAVEKKFRRMFETFKKEMELQAIAASTLWELIQRYRIAMEVDANCKRVQLYAVEPKAQIIQKYYIHNQVIVGSNKNQWWMLESLRVYVLAFRSECSKLDLDEETTFILGDAFHKPIQFFMELVDELFNYFLSIHLQLDCAARQLDPMDLESLEHYQKLLQPNEDFEEYFLYNLSYCQCLRLPPKCPVVHVYTSVESAAKKKEALAQAKRTRCEQRRARMKLRASQLKEKERQSVDHPESVTQKAEEPPKPDSSTKYSALLPDPLSRKFELQLMSERHTRQLYSQMQQALRQS